MGNEIHKLTEIIKRGAFFNLATQDEGGLWVSSLAYVHDDNLNLYWRSSRRARHSEALVRNRNVAANIVIGDGRKGFRQAVQIAGLAERVDHVPRKISTAYQARAKVHPETMNGVIDHEESWYVLRISFAKIPPQRDLGEEVASLYF